MEKGTKRRTPLERSGTMRGSDRESVEGTSMTAGTHLVGATMTVWVLVPVAAAVAVPSAAAVAVAVGAPEAVAEGGVMPNLALHIITQSSRLSPEAIEPEPY